MDHFDFAKFVHTSKSLQSNLEDRSIVHKLLLTQAQRPYLYLESMLNCKLAWPTHFVDANWLY